MKKEIYYLVRIRYGDAHDWGYLLVFVTPDKAKADEWKARYNRIIAENKERMNEFWKIDEDEKEPYQAAFIYFENPKAVIHIVEKR